VVNRGITSIDVRRQIRSRIVSRAGSSGPGKKEGSGENPGGGFGGRKEEGAMDFGKGRSGRRPSASDVPGPNRRHAEKNRSKKRGVLSANNFLGDQVALSGLMGKMLTER